MNVAPARLRSEASTADEIRTDRFRLTRITLPFVSATEPDIYRRLDGDFYEPRVATLTAAEQDLLLASARAAYPPLRVSELNLVTGKSSGNVNVLLGRLVEAGVLYRIRKGEYGYTALKFRDYLLRRAGTTEPTIPIPWTDGPGFSGRVFVANDGATETRYRTCQAH